MSITVDFCGTLAAKDVLDGKSFNHDDRMPYDVLVMVILQEVLGAQNFSRYNWMISLNELHM